jgi:hypothetical protein
MRASAFIIPLFFAALAAQAEVVRCTDASGKISYTDGPCPPGSRVSRQVPIDESPPPPVPMPRLQPEASGPSAYAPPPAAAPPGLAIIPRNPIVDQPAADPPPVYIIGPDPYYDGPPRHRFHRQPPQVRDPGPPPGQRPCQNLAGIKRNNC